MARCWTCGATVSGWHYTCSACQDLKELRELREKVKTVGLYYGDIFKRRDYLYRMKKDCINALIDTLSKETPEINPIIASAIEWGFGEIDWQLQQHTELLRGIDRLLKTPQELRSNEWRRMAEESRRRGLLDESEDTYLRAIELHHLDYRNYVGLAETHLQKNQFDKAKTFLEESLLYAPKSTADVDSYNFSRELYNLLSYGRKNNALNMYIKKFEVSRSEAEKAIFPIEKEAEEDRRFLALGYKVSRYKPSPVIDYQSYSLRLIGHIYACEERYDEAYATLMSSVELSPRHVESAYDIAQYSAMIDNTGDCIFYLLDAILAEPFYYYLAQHERNFDPFRNEVGKLLSDLLAEASHKARDTITKSETVLNEAEETISNIREAVSVFRDKVTLVSSTIYVNALDKLRLAREKIALADYRAFLEAKQNADESHALAINAINTAIEERGLYQKRRAEKIKKVWENVPSLLLSPLIGLILGTISGCSAGCTIGFFLPGKVAQNIGTGVGSLVGAVLGIIIGIIIAFDKMRSELRHKE